MKIRNIITTSALVVLLGLTGGSLYANGLGDNDSHTPGSAVSELVYTASSDVNAVETASTDSFSQNEIPVSDK